MIEREKPDDFQETQETPYFNKRREKLAWIPCVNQHLGVCHESYSRSRVELCIRPGDIVSESVGKELVYYWLGEALHYSIITSILDDTELYIQLLVGNEVPRFFQVLA